MDDVKRLTIQGDTEAPPLPDRIVNDPTMTSEDPSVDMDDISWFGCARPQLFDHGCITPFRHKADVLAVRLGRDGEFEPVSDGPGLGFREVTKRKSKEVELLARGSEQEVALIARGIDRPVQLRSMAAL